MMIKSIIKSIFCFISVVINDYISFDQCSLRIVLGLINEINLR